MIAVEDPILAIGLETVLAQAEDLEPVGTVGSLPEIRKTVRTMQPDVVLLDVSFRQRDESLVPELNSVQPKSRVLVLVDHEEDECALRSLMAASKGAGLSEEAVELLADCCLVSLRSSAWGCLPKGSQPDRVLTAIRAVAAGEIAAAPWLAALLSRDDGMGRVPRWQRERPITRRELQVIALVAQGLSNKGVASRLGIREQTVKNHIGRIMKKLGLESRLEIGLFAVKHNVALRDEVGSRSTGGGTSEARSTRSGYDLPPPH